jgi:hypothetical protein
VVDLLAILHGQLHAKVERVLPAVIVAVDLVGLNGEDG